MSRLHKRFAKPGTAPGTLRAPEEKRVEEVEIQVIEYGPDRVEEWKAGSVAEVFERRHDLPVTWVDVVGLHDVEVLQAFGERLGLHPLALEDVLNTGQRPKVESYEDHLFIVLKGLHAAAEPGQPHESEQISLFLGQRFVLTFQEVPGDSFEPVRERIRAGGRRLHASGPDYLTYALVDALVDSLFPVLEALGEHLEELEEEVLERPDRNTVAEIQRAKKELFLLRRTAWPEREVVSALERHESPLISKETRVFLRDSYDHSVQIMDIVEGYRDTATGLLDIYLSSLSNRMNEVMKVLTSIAAIFIPLTFLAGIYGMNFDTTVSPWNLPELGWYWGYPAFWGVTIVLGVTLVIVFKRKGWL